MTDTTIFTASGTNAAEDYIASGWGDVNKLNGSGDYVQWAHHYTFNPAADHLLSGKLTLSFRDDAGEGDGGLAGWRNEYAFGYAESGDWALGEVDTGNYSYDVGISTLADGIFQVTVASLYGDFYLDKSVLEINYAPVPEPATLLLLGFGLAGLAFYRRKKAA